jgi:uncharacterized protein (TIGR02186 family)
MRRAIFIIAVLTASAPAKAERLTIAVSTPQISISSNFTGTPITVFGVIERDNRRPIPEGTPYSVAILLLGPNENVVARRKDRVVGIWLNHAAHSLVAVPSFYSLSSNEAAEDVANAPVLQRLQIGFNNIALAIDGRVGADDPEAREFRDAFLRLKEDDGLYSETRDVTFIGDSIFRSISFLPANIPVGRYTVAAYVFSEGELVGHAQDRIEVTKAGFEGAMAAFVRNQSLIYGIFCAALAVFVGWAGGVIFRRD